MDRLQQVVFAGQMWVACWVTGLVKIEKQANQSHVED